MFKNKLHDAFGVNMHVLKFFMLYIPQYTEVEKKRYKYFLAISVFLRSCTYISSGGSTIIHLYFVKREKLDVDITEHLAIIVSTIGIVTICLAYPIYSKDWSKTLRSLTDYRMFGKPPKTDKTIKFCNRVAILTTIFFFQCVALYEATVLYGGKSCLKLAEEKGLHINCLTMCPVWLPFEVNVSTQLIISLVQFILMAYAVIPIGLASLLPWEVSQQLTIHIQHLNNMFNNIFETDDKEEQRRRLSKWIKYNQRIIKIIGELNRLTKACVGIVSLVVSIVFAVTVNQLISWNKPLAAIMHISGWLWSLTTNCITGQQIITQTKSITTNIVCSKWYMADLRVKKDILFILLNTQRSFRLSALPFGTLNMELLLLIMKSSYSYITLLKKVT